MIGVLSVLATSQTSLAQTTTAEIENGNVVLQENGRRTALTTDGKDTDAILSGDESMLAFIYVVDASKKPGEFSPSQTELWVARRSEQWMPKALLAQPIIRQAARLQSFRYPAFSPDGKLIYFLVTDYSTVSPGVFWIRYL